ncbi:MAG: DinB family protein [Planctomycetaceae bacterium]|nr:DinB family protein [Planctomycetaceae bacterium]
MSLLNRLLGHDAWTTRQLLMICAGLSDDILDREHDIGHRTLRQTLAHIISNMEIWSSMMANEDVGQSKDDQTIDGLLRRLSLAETRLRTVAQQTETRNAWDQLWTDTLDNPPQQKSFGAAIAHVVTHSMHHRAQVIYMLRLSGVDPLPEGDVFSWEAAVKQ